MKTRNNQSNADETILNQSITRRSFVKRGAVASAATVFGIVPAAINAAALRPIWKTIYKIANPVTINYPPGGSEPDMDIVEAADITASGAVVQTFDCYSMLEGEVVNSRPAQRPQPQYNAANERWEITYPAGNYTIIHGSVIVP